MNIKTERESTKIQRITTTTTTTAQHQINQMDIRTLNILYKLK
ncbi:MAG TPA: hypothetical protein VE244_17425 [Nitrososphaeraceae archaeon]|nr:hypothetical protein [Nitrososphaeraceae archaeon]